MIFLDEKTIEQCIYPIFIHDKRYLLDKDPYTYFLEKTEESECLRRTINEIMENAYFQSDTVMGDSDVKTRALHRLYQKFVNDPDFLYHFITDGGHFIVDVEMYRIEENMKNNGEYYDS